MLSVSAKVLTSVIITLIKIDWTPISRMNLFPPSPWITTIYTNVGDRQLSTILNHKPVKLTSANMFQFLVRKKTQQLYVRKHIPDTAKWRMHLWEIVILMIFNFNVCMFVLPYHQCMWSARVLKKSKNFFSSFDVCLSPSFYIYSLKCI